LSKPAIILQQRGLAAAGRAKQRKELAFADDEIGFVERQKRAIGAGNVVDLDHRPR
jgi:hypothetical protein